ncbi:MAG: hypothetical protein J6D08_18310 [Lachnospiraceae bacterium]|nr:hypothetical protein [Lachnospiraceae bacterium]
MVSVLLTILKIIGIVILILLGLLLFLLLVVLFVPVRYKAKGGGQRDDFAAELRASWLLHIVSLRGICHKGQAFHLRLKLFGIPVYDNLKINTRKMKNKKEKQTKTNSKEHTGEIQAASLEEGAEENQFQADRQNEKTFGNSAQKQADCTIETPILTDNSVFDGFDKGQQTQEEHFFQKVKRFVAVFVNFFKNIKFTFRKICDTMVKIKDNIKYYLELLQLDSTKRAFSTCAKQLKRIFKHVSPKKYQVNLHLGFEDPAVMGEVLAVWGMLYPWHLGNIDIQPEFDHSVLEGTFLLKGHISVYTFVWTACILLFDRDIKHLMKHLKRNM